MPITLETGLSTEFKLLDTDPANIAADCLVIGITQGKKIVLSTKLDKQSIVFLEKCLKQANMEGKIGQSMMLYQVPGIKAASVLLIGCGKPSELHEAQYKAIYSIMIKNLSSSHAKSVICCLNQLEIKGRDAEWSIRFAVESIAYEIYDFHYFKPKAEK
ncbi:MAG: multifunctional aminopeptidase, partial [Gammaproteobacteria bacterium]|nr:multifunctional aminopeptidase [Gammaproteobacteria bacterium]